MSSCGEIIIRDIERYHFHRRDGDLVATPYIDLEQLKKTKVSFSKIKNCVIKDEDDEIISTNSNYRGILFDIYREVYGRFLNQQLYAHTTYNMKFTNEYGNDGYKWNEDVCMSIQNKDANGALKDIINMVTINNLSIDISIQLKNGNSIYFKK